MASTDPAYSIRYGQQHLTVPLPEGVRCDVVGRRAIDGIDSDRILRDALQHPLDAPSLRDFVHGAKNLLVVVNDATRSTPTARILDAIWPELTTAAHWRVIIASGLHRGPRDGETETLFGAHLAEIAPRLLVHDGYDKSQLATVESDDEPIQINKALLEADRVILINSVEPHFFAGYTGGRKSIIPGLAGYDTVERSHAGAVTRDAAVLRVAGNPVREFIHRHTRIVADKILWSIQVVLEKNDRIAYAFAGNVDKTFTAACEAARNCYVVEIDAPYDVVIGAIHPPLDLSLYQGMKGWELPMAGVRDGGVLIMTAPCWEGVGARFYARLIDQYPDRAQWAGLEGRPYTLGLHKLVRTARALKRFRLFAVTGMSAAEVKRYGYVPFESLAAALAAAFDYVGRPARLLIVEDSALTTVVRNHDPMHAEKVRLKTETERFDI